MYTKLILVDYSYMINRYYYALKHRTKMTEQGELFLGSVEGFTHFTARILNANPNTMIIFCQDGSSIERKKIDEKYKANREERKDKEERLLIHVSTPDIMNILSNCKDIMFAKVEDKEADDVIALLALKTKAKYANTEVIVYSGDKDFLQLLEFGIKISNDDTKGKIKFVTEDDVFAKFGVGVERLLKLRVMLGDSSDNIKPPVSRMFETDKRRFIDLWHDFGLEEAINKMKEEKPKVGSKLEENKEVIIKNLDLMSLGKYKDDLDAFDIKLFKIPNTDPALIDKYGLIDYRHFLRIKYGI